MVLSNNTIGVYIHVPYCIRKCRYCDFVSFERPPEEGYFAELAEDIKAAENASVNGIEHYVDTLFFGGGTPSLASRAQLETVLGSVRGSFEMADGAEVSIEVNPETVTKQKAADLKELGFTRVSMGVQSFDDAVLKAIGRIHSAERARQAFKILRGAGFDNINLDLMFGLPRQSADGAPGVQDLGIWQETLDEAIDLGPEHISFYSLQLEEDTPLWAAYRNGAVRLPSWEENRAMYHHAVAKLREKGYNHYEVSNAAKPGFECRHNLRYWSMQPYLGFGISAHSFMPVFSEDGRFAGGYRGEADWSKADPFDGLQKESLTDLKGDFIFTQLRLIRGLDTGFYRQLFGTDLAEEFADPLEKLASEGFITVSDGRVVLTPYGLDNTNPVMQELLYALL